MALFKSKDKKWKTETVTDRKGNQFNIPVDDDGHVPKEALRERFLSRYSQPFSKGMLRDLSRQSSRTYPDKMTPQDALQYWKHTNRYDVEGIDAPDGSANYFPEKKLTTKKDSKKKKPKAPAPPKRAPFAIPPRREREKVNDYERRLHSELTKWAGEDYTTVWGLDGFIERLKVKYGEDVKVAQISSVEYVYAPFADEYVKAHDLVNEAVKQARIDDRNASKSQDDEIRARVEARRASAGQSSAPAPTATNVNYGRISEETAKRAKESYSWDDYRAGSVTADYKETIDKVNAIATEQKSKVDPMYWGEIDRLVQQFATKYADWINRYNANEARVPSVMIAGPSNFPVRKKEKQNSARDRLWEEHENIMKIVDRIESTGKGGIRSDDNNAVAKIEDKLVKLQDQHNSAVRINKAIRDGENSKAFQALSEDEKKEATMRIAKKAPIPGWQLSNETAEIRRLKGRLADLEKEAQRRAEGPSSGDYPSLDGCEVMEDASDSRIKLIFDDKPSATARGILKSNGFRWSPRNSAWQRELNDNGRYAAKRALEAIIAKGGWEE